MVTAAFVAVPALLTRSRQLYSRVELRPRQFLRRGARSSTLQCCSKRPLPVASKHPALPPSSSGPRTDVIRRMLLGLVGTSLVARVLPVGASVAALLRTGDPTSFVSGLTAAFLLVLASEIGDKTFFISALLSMKYSRVLVLLGTMLALGAMTIISVGIGQIFHALPPSLNTTIPFDDYAAVALLLWFGFQNIRDALRMRDDEDEELQDAKDVVAGKVVDESGGVRVVAETSSLIFLAEWGDKSMLATVALAAAKSPIGVIVGGISGHFIATLIAIIGGSYLGKFISEKTARLIAGVLFIVFAILTVFSIY